MRLLAFILLITALAPDADAQRRRRCSGEPPDSAWMAESPVYRDCEVDKAALRRGSEPALDYTPDRGSLPRGVGCFVAEFRFVVDTTGAVEPGTVRATRADERTFTDKVAASLPQLTFRPAERDGAKVRQVVTYRRTLQVATSFTVTTVQGGSAGAPASAMPSSTARGQPPRCN